MFLSISRHYSFVQMYHYLFITPTPSCSSPSLPYFFMPPTLKREPLCTGLSSLCRAQEKKREKGNLKIGCCPRAEERDDLRALPCLLVFHSNRFFFLFCFFSIFHFV